MKKILWAIDAFQSDVSLERASIELLKNLAKKTGATIEPVYVLSPTQLNLSMDFTPDLISHYQPAALKVLQNTLRNTSIPGLTEPKVIIEPSASLNQSALALNRYAIANDADLIAVGTHAKKGLQRLFLGSFTETLLLQSSVPVLTLNPQAKRIIKDHHVFFATDASEAAYQAFGPLLRLLKDLKAKLTLYHYVRNPIEPIVQSGTLLLGGGWVAVPSYVRRESTQVEHELEKMAQLARKEGIATEVLVDSGFEGITEGILENSAKQKASMIALAGQMGAVAAALLGSITRQVVRSSELPVWVIHTEKPKKSASRKKRARSTRRS